MFAVRLLIVISAMFASVVATSSASARQKEAPPAPSDVRTFAVSPAAEPVPAFKYRLYPLASARKSGNAVPIYLRFAHERSPESKKAQLQESSKFLDEPDATFNLAGAKKLVEDWSGVLRQIDHAARKQTADWSYTIEEERENIFGILLGDAQEMRGQHRLACLKARVEIAEEKFPEAARSIETTFSMAEQVAEGPFLINGLVGLACALKATDQVDTFINRPGSPNLYWALTTIPPGSIGLRKGLDNEFSLIDVAFPEFEGLDKASGEAEFAGRLKRVRDRLEAAGKMAVEPKQVGSMRFADDALGLAKAYLRSRKVVTPEALAAMPESKIVLVAIKAQYEEIRDERFKALLLPSREARVLESRPEPTSKPTEIYPFTLTFLPFLYNATQAETRLDRRLAALRLIEALRMHAAANGSKLPSTLDDVKVVTVPDDPSTGRPFAYKLDGETAVIASPRSGRNVPDLKYSVSIRN